MKVFEASGPRGLSWTIPVFMPDPIVSRTSREDAVARYRELEAKAEKYLGRRLTEHEMEHGVTKKPLTQEQIIEARRQQVRVDRAARLEREAAFSPEAERLRVARERAEAERVAALTPAQRELESATKAAEEAEQRRIDKAKKAELRQTGAYQQLRTAMDNLLLISKLSVDIPLEQVALVEAESIALEKHMDLATTRQNLAQLQKVVSGQLAVQDAALKAAVDRAELRKKMLSAGQVWDDVGVEMLGETEYVSLTHNGETKRVTKATFDARQSDEALRDTLFGTSEVANV